MSDIPRRTAARTAKLASLPLGVAGRAVGGWGRRLVGGDGEEISAQLMAKSAEQLFAVLGELKGGAMKFGQALSVFEAAIPDEYAAPFRESLVKLQTAAPPMPTADVHRMLAEQFGRGWRARFTAFDDTPAAAASIGQVHRGVWHDGREVAVKVQYPGAEEALRSDLRQLSRMSRVLQPLMPGLEIKPLIAELRERMEEELDYRDEAANQRAFATAFDGDDKVRVPKVVASAPKAMVTEWVTGRKLSDVIRDGHPGRARRRRGAAGRAALLLAAAGWGCCTPTRTRATSSCSTTAACSCSTSARSPGSPTASPGRCRSWCGSRWRTAPTTCSRCCAGRASCCRARR